MTAAQMWPHPFAGAAGARLALLLLNQPRKKPQIPVGSGVKLQEVAPRQDTPEAPTRAAPVEACFQPGTCTLLFLTIIVRFGRAGCVCKTGAFCCGGGWEAGDESLVLF